MNKFYLKYKIRIPVAQEDYKHFLSFKERHFLNTLKLKNALKKNNLLKLNKQELSKVITNIIRIKYEISLLHSHDKISDLYFSSVYVNPPIFNKANEKEVALSLQEYYLLTTADIHPRKFLILFRKGYTIEEIIEYGELPTDWLINAL